MHFDPETERDLQELHKRLPYDPPAQGPDLECVEAFRLLALHGGLTARSEERIKSAFKDQNRAENFLMHVRSMGRLIRLRCRDRLRLLYHYYTHRATCMLGW